jgi:hypothetical protein
MIFWKQRNKFVIHHTALRYMYYKHFSRQFNFTNVWRCVELHIVAAVEVFFLYSSSYT